MAKHLQPLQIDIDRTKAVVLLPRRSKAADRWGDIRESTPSSSSSVTPRDILLVVPALRSQRNSLCRDLVWLSNSPLPNAHP